MDTSSLVNLYDRLDDQRKEKAISKTPSFDFGSDNDKSDSDYKLPDSISPEPQSDEMVGNSDDTPTLDVTEPATPRLGLPTPVKTFSYRPPQSLIDKMRAQDEIANDPTSGGFDQDYDSFWRKKINHHCDKIKDRCCKHFILDIYCKSVPLDHEFVCKNKKTFSDDIDVFLDKKKMSPYQYMSAAAQETKAPLLQHLLDESDEIAHDYYQKTYKEMTDNEKRGIKVNPKEPTVDEKEALDKQIVDVTEDPEYSKFVQTLKEKTRDKIVEDVTALIKSKDADKDLEFDPKKGQKPNEEVLKEKAKKEFAPEISDAPEMQESVLLQCMNYGSKKCIKEEVEITPKINEELIGLAIRESTLCNIDRVFNLRNHTEELNKLSMNLFLNKAFVFTQENLNKIIK